MAPPSGKTTDPAEEEDNFDYPKGFRLALLMLSIFLGMFLVALVCLHQSPFSHC